MSSSRVIKRESLSRWSVANLNFEQLGGERSVDLRLPPQDAEGFTPLLFADHLEPSAHAGTEDRAGDAPVHAATTPGEIPAGMLLLTESEFQARLEEARQRGVEEGRQVAERGLAHVFRALRNGTDSLGTLREKVLRESEGDLLKLSRLVAKKIILQEVRQDPGILARIVAATVSCCAENDRITIRLSPADYEAVRSNRIKFEGVPGDADRVMLAADESISLGGCLVETPTGTVDARIEAQLDEVYSRCMEERGIPRDDSAASPEAEQRI